MPRRFTMANLVTRCKRRADQENQSFISDAEWKAMLGEVYGELWEEVALTGYRYFELETEITADGSESYDEPVAHLSTVSIDRVTSDGQRIPLTELMHSQEHLYAGKTGDAVAYMLIDDLLYLFPNPSSGTYKWRYIQQPPDLGTYADGDVVDVVSPGGEAFVIWGAKVLAADKGEGNAELALRMMDRARERVQVWCANRTQDGRRRVPHGAPDVDANVDDGDIL